MDCVDKWLLPRPDREDRLDNPWENLSTSPQPSALTDLSPLGCPQVGQDYPPAAGGLIDGGTPVRTHGFRTLSTDIHIRPPSYPHRGITRVHRQGPMTGSQGAVTQREASEVAGRSLRLGVTTGGGRRRSVEAWRGCWR